MVSRKKRSNAAKKKKADKTFLELHGQLENEAEFLRLLTQTQRGKVYPINHCHSDIGWTLLHEACDYNMPSAVKAILSRKDVDINLQRTAPEGDVPACPLYVACSEGHLDCVKLLCQAPGIDLNAKSIGWGYPLFGATRAGRQAVVRFLLTKVPNGKINYNAIHRFGNTVFLEAIQYGHKRIVKMFLDDKRINHHRHNPYTGWNAMDMACWAGSPTLIRLLEAKGFAPPIKPVRSSLIGRIMFTFDKFLTERRALAEDYVLRETHKSCNGCKKQFQRVKLERCSNCLGVWYCGRKCQKAHWKCHKPNCFKKIPKDVYDDPEGSSPEIVHEEILDSSDDESSMEMIN